MRMFLFSLSFSSSPGSSAARAISSACERSHSSSRRVFSSASRARLSSLQAAARAASPPPLSPRPPPRAPTLFCLRAQPFLLAPFFLQRFARAAELAPGSRERRVPAAHLHRLFFQTGVAVEQFQMALRPEQRLMLVLAVNMDQRRADIG